MWFNLKDYAEQLPHRLDEFNIRGEFYTQINGIISPKKEIYSLFPNYITVTDSNKKQLLMPINHVKIKPHENNGQYAIEFQKHDQLIYMIFKMYDIWYLWKEALRDYVVLGDVHDCYQFKRELGKGGTAVVRPLYSVK